MTGRYVHQHGVDHMQPEIGTTPGLPPWETTVMERLQGAGYRTAAFGKIHMMPPRGLDEMALTMGKGARWTVASGSPLGPSQLGPVYAAWLEGKRPGAYEEIYAQRREPEYREQAGAVVNCLAADEYVDYWIGENTWQYLERLADTPSAPSSPGAASVAPPAVRPAGAVRQHVPHRRDAGAGAAAGPAAQRPARRPARPLRPARTARP